MWGIVPAAGAHNRIQPLAFSKELLPVGSRVDAGEKRPRAVSEYLIERLNCGGADKLCVIISPGKADIPHYYDSRAWGADIVYGVQPHPGGLCDAVFRVRPLVRADETVAIGLSDTIWSPQDALRSLSNDALLLLPFSVDTPEFFDAVVTGASGEVREIQVKRRDAQSNWIWGAIKMPGRIYHSLYDLWRAPEPGDEFLGTLLNAWLARGGSAVGVRAGSGYVDVGTLHGYRDAIRLLQDGVCGSHPASLLFAQDQDKNAIDIISR